LQERYPRVARYYEISYDAANRELAWKGLTDKKAIAKNSTASYVSKPFDKI